MKTFAIKRVIHLGIIALACFITLNASIADGRSSEVPDATQSDPAILSWMMGSPPPEDRILRFSDGSYFRFPAMRWSVSSSSSCPWPTSLMPASIARLIELGW